MPLAVTGWAVGPRNYQGYRPWNHLRRWPTESPGPLAHGIIWAFGPRNYQGHRPWNGYISTGCSVRSVPRQFTCTAVLGLVLNSTPRARYTDIAGANPPFSSHPPGFRRCQPSAIDERVLPASAGCSARWCWRPEAAPFLLYLRMGQIADTGRLAALRLTSGRRVSG